MSGVRAALLDLAERTSRAQRRLVAMAETREGSRDRLLAKAEGVGLARSYVEEALRTLGTEVQD